MTVSADKNQFGRPSELRLHAGVRNGATVVDDLYFTMPQKVMRPFTLDENNLVGSRARKARSSGVLAAPIQTMVMSTSAGVMAGDDLRQRIEVGPNAALQVTTQSFEKVHKMAEGTSARRTICLLVGEGGYLDYRPQPQIPFAGSSFESTTEIELVDTTSTLAYEEVLSCGRVARGERFCYCRYQNRVSILVAGVPVYLDNTLYLPGHMDMAGLGLFEGFSHLANLVVVNAEVGEGSFAGVRDFLREETGVIGAAAGGRMDSAVGSDAIAGGITRLGSGDIVVRLLGHRAQRLQEVLAHVRGLLC